MKKILKVTLIFLITAFVILNVLSYMHAYKFTHFTTKNIKRTHKAEKLSLLEKITVLAIGISNPKPQNHKVPDRPYRTIHLMTSENQKIECWLLESENNIGTIICFHAYRSMKSSRLEEAYKFNELGYNVVLVDFLGCGGSDGYQTTIGFYEAENVITSFNYFKNKEKPIFLYGVSMGATAILRALNISEIEPEGVILECPFGSMLQTVKNRFYVMRLPATPFAQLVVFWGGVQHGFWAFNHQSSEYARNIKTPVLLMYGNKDARVTFEEIMDIYDSLKGFKKLKIFENGGHESYYKMESKEWLKEVEIFLKRASKDTLE